MNNVSYIKDIKSFNIWGNKSEELNDELEKCLDKIQKLGGMIIDVKPTLSLSCNTFEDTVIIFSALIVFHDRYNRIKIDDLYE